MSYHGHVLFEPVRPEIVKLGLNNLNFLYNDVVVHLDNIPFDLMFLDQIPIVREGNTHEEIDPIDELEEGENPLDQYRVSANESALIPTIPCEAS